MSRRNVFALPGKPPAVTPVDLSGRANFRLKKTLHFAQRTSRRLAGLTGYGVGGNDDVVVSYERVLGREENADVRGEACYDQSADLEIIEDNLERRAVERALLRFKD